MISTVFNMLLVMHDPVLNRLWEDAQSKTKTEWASVALWN